MKLHLTDTSGIPYIFDAIRGMKLHLTDASARSVVYDALQCHPYTLLSFAYKDLEPCYASTWVREDCEIILDSGAFTAWSAGREVDRDQYLSWALAFTQRHQNKLKAIRYINLDVIPGSRGVSATPEQLKQAARSSMENADYFRRQHLPVIEVFHQDEPIELLDQIVERSAGNLIAISPRNDVSTQRRERWLKSLAAYCVKRYGIANFPPAHGLAVTGESLVYSFPFYSVDSSSWTQCLRFGVSKASGLPKLPRWKNKDTQHTYGHALKKEVDRYRTLADRATQLWKQRGITWDD